MHIYKSRPNIYQPLLLFSVILYACTKSNSIGENTELVHQDNVTSVHVGVVERKPFVNFIACQGRIEPNLQYLIESPMDGVIVSSSLSDGKSVIKGEKLLMFDPNAFEIRLNRAENHLYNAKVEYQSELLGYNHNKKEISDSVALKVKQASGLLDAEIDIKELRAEIKKSVIIAPVSGKIANVGVQVGQHINAGQRIATVYSDKNLHMNTYILESDFHLIEINQKARLTPVAYPDRSYKAYVSSINPLVNEDGLVEIRLQLEQTDGLLPGMNVNGAIEIISDQTVAVPKSAIVMRSGKPVIFTIENGVAQWNYVSTGNESDSLIEIKSGIAAGQKIILSNNLQLSQDSPVTEVLK